MGCVLLISICNCFCPFYFDNLLYSLYLYIKSALGMKPIHLPAWTMISLLSFSVDTNNSKQLSSHMFFGMVWLLWMFHHCIQWTDHLFGILECSQDVQKLCVMTDFQLCSFSSFPLQLSSQTIFFRLEQLPSKSMLSSFYTQFGEWWDSSVLSIGIEFISFSRSLLDMCFLRRVPNEGPCFSYSAFFYILLLRDLSDTLIGFLSSFW